MGRGIHFGAHRSMTAAEKAVGQGSAYVDIHAIHGSFQTTVQRDSHSNERPLQSANKFRQHVTVLMIILLLLNVLSDRIADPMGRFCNTLVLHDRVAR